jgi:hypothetical protein
MILSAYGTLLDETLGVADLWLRKGEEEPQFILAKLSEMLQQRAAKKAHSAQPPATQ